MAARTKINDYGDCIFSEQDAVDLLYTDPNFDLTKLFFEDTASFNSTVHNLGLDFPQLKQAPQRDDLKSFDEQNINNWHMP